MKWTAEKNSAWGKMLDVVDQDGKGVAFFQREDDARLAALAPEMVQVLRVLRKVCPSGINWKYGIGKEILMDVDAVLAKLEEQS